MGFGGSSEAFIQGALIFGVITLFLMPVMISVLMTPATEEFDTNPTVSQDRLDEFNTAYMNFTTNGSKKEQPWALTGIYTPYSGGTYHYTPDGWLYGEVIPSYSPEQYKGTAGEYTVVRGMGGTANTDDRFTGVLYTYTTSATLDGHNRGDAYTYVTMDITKQSEIFFTEQLKHTVSNPVGGGFYYEYTGYRYCFQALESGYTSYTDADGNKGITKLNATTSSLSLIWYNYASQTGISGQLILSGSDYGVSQLTAGDIVSAFNSSTNTAKFEMHFNGIPMFIYIRVDPYMTRQGLTVEECYNQGFWSIMVSSLSTDPQDYYTSDFSFTPEKILDTAIALMSFNMDEYDMSDTMRILSSLVFNMVLLTMLLAIGLKNPKILLIAGIAALVVLVQDYLVMIGEAVMNFVNAVIEFFQNIADSFQWPPEIDISIDTEEWDWWPWN